MKRATIAALALGALLLPGTALAMAMKTKNLTIFDHAHVTRIMTGADGRVTGVSYIRDGQEYFQPAKVVLLASYTYENSRLLLLSKSKAYPNGLSNSVTTWDENFLSAGSGVR